MAKPSDSELDDIAAHLLLFKPAGTSQLPLPTHDPSLDAKYGALATDPMFDDLGFGIVEYGDPAGAKTFLHNPDENWDIGSCGKTSIVTASLALLRDIQGMTNAGVIVDTVDPARFDALLRYVWGRHPDATRLPRSPARWAGAARLARGRSPDDPRGSVRAPR